METTNPYEKSVIVAHWQEKLDIHYGMSKEKALDKFVEWRMTKKTCLRCEGDKLAEFCPVYLICQEADNVRDVARDDNRRRTPKAVELETFRTDLSQKRERAAVR